MKTEKRNKVHEHLSMASLTVEMQQCGACGKVSCKKLLKLCAKCKSVYYCNIKCQEHGWISGHKNDCSKKMFERLFRKGAIHHQNHNLKDAHKYQKFASKAAKETKNVENIAYSYHIRGQTYEQQGKYDKALELVFLMHGHRQIRNNR